MMNVQIYIKQCSVYLLTFRVSFRELHFIGFHCKALHGSSDISIRYAWIYERFRSRRSLFAHGTWKSTDAKMIKQQGGITKTYFRMRKATVWLRARYGMKLIHSCSKGMTQQPAVSFENLCWLAQVFVIVACFLFTKIELFDSYGSLKIVNELKRLLPDIQESLGLCTILPSIPSFKRNVEMRWMKFWEVHLLLIGKFQRHL